MIEENVVAAAGTSFRTTKAAIRRSDHGRGISPGGRNVFYEIVEQCPSARLE